MYFDARHVAPYHIENPQWPGFKDGDFRNVYLEPYNREIRELTAARGYRLADTYRRLAAETAKGKWDLRLRADEGDPKNDPKHVGDMRWLDNIHPNDQGTEVIAEGLVEALVKRPGRRGSAPCFSPKMWLLSLMLAGAHGCSTSGLRC